MRTRRSHPPRRALLAGTLALLLCVITQGSAAHAQIVDEPENFETARGLGMGTGVRASALSTSAVAYNAANMPLGSLYHLEGYTGFEPRVGRWILGASVVDSMTSRLAMGFAFRGILSDGEQGYSGFDGKLALAFPLSEMISIGVAGRYMSFTYDGPTVGSLKSGDSRAQHFTMDGSVRVTVTPGLNIAALAYNFVDAKSDLVPIQVGGSASYSTDSGFTFGADSLVDTGTFKDVKVTAGGGAEFLAAGQFPIRAGYRFDQGREQHAITFGLGFVNQAMGLDLGWLQVVKPTPGTKANTELMLSFRYFVQ
jgi:hypothetical protein